MHYYKKVMQEEAANANLDEQAYPQCIGGVLSVMHGFNSVSGMWSDSQLKGRGGQKRGKEQMKKETEEEEAHRAWSDGRVGNRVSGWQFSTFGPVYGLFGIGERQR